MALNLESELKEQTDNLRGLIDSLSLTPRQKRELKKQIYDNKFLVTDYSLSEGERESLNREIKSAYERLESAYRDAENCPAVSEWMSDPREVVQNIWKGLIK